MSQGNEIPEVVAKMRHYADRHWMHESCQVVREFADLTEAAWKRACEHAEKLRRVDDAIHARQLMAAFAKSGNAAKLREALSDACYAMFNFLKAQNGGYEEMANALDKAKAALAAPPRNCDVGTAEEWLKRQHDTKECEEALKREIAAERESEAGE